MAERAGDARRELIAAIDRALSVGPGEFRASGAAIIDSCNCIADYFYGSADPDRTLWRSLFIRVLTEGPWAGKTMNPIGSKLVEVAGRRNWTAEMAFAREQLERLAAGQPVDAPSARDREGSCYIATAVYGSYDCPEVRVLRRFRDETLLKIKGGPTFVRLYHSIAPILVRCGGPRLHRVARPPLDALIGHLRRNGVDDCPYLDGPSHR